MIDQINEYKYSKQFILIEDVDKSFSRSPYASIGHKTLGRYLYSIVTSVVQKEVDGVYKHLIQHDEKELGWVDLETSIPIYRFKPILFKIIEEDFKPNDLNIHLGIDQDILSIIKGKILTVKSQINYKGDTHYGVFLKDRFLGFHHERYLDPLFKVNIPLAEENFDKDIKLYKMSNLKKPIRNLPESMTGELASLFPANEIARIKLNGKFYWVNLNHLINLELPTLELEEKSISQLTLEDIFYSVDTEREKSKELIKTVLSAKLYLSSKEETEEIEKKLYDIIDMNTYKDDTEGLSGEIAKYADSSESDIDSEIYIEENENLKQQLKKVENEKKLAEKRLAQQIDYNKRLQIQRDKYNSRMKDVEEKLRHLNEKYNQSKKK